MIPLEPVSLDAKLFFLSAVEFGSRLFLGPAGGDDAAWLELVVMGPAELANMLPQDRPAGREHDFGLPALLARLTGREAAGGPEALRHEFVRLFISDKGGALVPPYESCHPATAPHDALPSPVMGPAALAMRERLAASGLGVGLPGNEPPDHLGLELEYLAYLLAKGWFGGQPDRLPLAGAFCREALAAWLPVFHARLHGADRTGVFAAASAVILAVVRRLSDLLPGAPRPA